MVEKIGPIKNPLTIIAIFAAIAEISGTVVLPFISEANQGTYIWFLMLFPLLLIVLFFLTLNFNHKVLYAPSDFKDEGNFFKSFQPASAIDRDEKLREQVREATEEAAQSEQSTPMQLNADPNSSGSTPSATTSSSTSTLSTIQARYALAEDLILNKIAQETGQSIRRDVRFGSADSKHRFIFDGVIMNNDKVTAIEIKYVRDRVNVYKRVRDVASLVASIGQNLSEDMRGRFSFIFALATDIPTDEHSQLMAKIHTLIGETPFPTEVRIFNLAQLENDFSK